METDNWRSLDGVWTVHRLPGWIRHGHACADFYQVKQYGRLVAEVDRFARIGNFIAVERLIADAPCPAVPAQRREPNAYVSD